ncbi:hypothetical protein QL285_088809 [Trifolium repens]|jgi:hypothetical protein|nr:hypothetical protein QL285_088809 [Trifolium repens]
MKLLLARIIGHATLSLQTKTNPTSMMDGKHLSIFQVSKATLSYAFLLDTGKSSGATIVVNQHIKHFGFDSSKWGKFYSSNPQQQQPDLLPTIAKL